MTIRSNRSRRTAGRIALRTTAAICALASLTAMAGCDGPVPQMQATSTAAAKTPDLNVDQEAKIRASILDTLKKADDAKDPSQLAQSVEGPALAVRTSQLTAAQGTGSLTKYATIPSDIEQTVIPTDTGWPRSVFTITDNTDAQGPPRLLVIDQSAARDNYKLWGVVRLFSGATLPQFPVPSVGATSGTAQDTGLVATPEQAVSMYADVLANGSASQYASQVADDSLRQTIGSLTQTVQQGVEGNKGTQKQTFTPVSGQLRVMHATGGGALVVAQIQSVWERTGGEGRESRPASDPEAALFGDGHPTSTMRVTYSNVIALFVPAEGQGQIQAVGAERQPIKVEAV